MGDIRRRPRKPKLDKSTSSSYARHSDSLSLFRSLLLSASSFIHGHLAYAVSLFVFAFSSSAATKHRVPFSPTLWYIRVKSESVFSAFKSSRFAVLLLLALFSLDWGGEFQGALILLLLYVAFHPLLVPRSSIQRESFLLLFVYRLVDSSNPGERARFVFSCFSRASLRSWPEPTFSIAVSTFYSLPFLSSFYSGRYPFLLLFIRLSWGFWSRCF